MPKKENIELSSEATFYGLREIPFEPTGAAATKYPYVPPEEFALIEEKIKEVMSERKLYVLLLKAPQGGGKTSTVEEIRKRATDGKYSKGKRTVFISNKLIDLEIKNYAADFINEASTYLRKRTKYIVNKRMTPTQLKKTLAEILKHLGQRNELVVWVIDEFDILVDHPKPVQSKFLQFIRDIIDDLADESLPTIFLMSHTWRSSKEFEDHLKEVHKPFRHRIVESLEIGYTYDEVRKIVATRLGSVALKKRKKPSISPFAEGALRELYESIVSLGGAEELTDFRFFERCCYYSVLRGAQKKLTRIGPELVRQIFEEQIGSEIIEPSESGISAHTKSEMITVIRGSPIERLESAFEGLSKGLDLSHEFSEIPVSITDYVGDVKPNICIGCWLFSGKHTKGGLFTTQWFVAFKPGGIIIKDELARIDKAVQKFRKKRDQPYPHLTILTYVNDVDLDTTDIQSCDEVLRISRDTMRKLIGFGVADTEEDTVILRKDFDSEILPNLREAYATRIKDITKSVTDSVIRAVEALHINYLAGEKLTRQSLKDQETSLSGRSRALGDRWIREMINLGFANDSSTSGLVPETPRSIRTLLDIFGKKRSIKVKDVEDVFDETSNFVLGLAQDLGIVEFGDRDVEKKRPSDIEKSFKDDIKEAESLMEKEDGGVAKETLGKILTALERSKQEGDEFSRYVVLSVAQKKLPRLNRMIEETKMIKAPSRAEVRPVLKVTVTEPKAAEAIAPFEESLADAILQCLEEKPLTYAELKSELAEMGFTQEPTSIMLKMIIKNRLKITL